MSQHYHFPATDLWPYCFTATNKLPHYLPALLFSSYVNSCCVSSQFHLAITKEIGTIFKLFINKSKIYPHMWNSEGIYKHLSMFDKFSSKLAKTSTLMENQHHPTHIYQIKSKLYLLMSKIDNDVCLNQ